MKKPHAALAVLTAFLLGVIAVSSSPSSAAPAADPCSSLYKSFPTNGQLQAYIRCRFDGGPSVAPSPTPTPSVTPTRSSTPSATPTRSSTPTPTKTATPTPTATATPTATPTPTVTSPAVLDLPRIAWEGADYWGQFSKTNAAGWDDPSFFPIVLWYGSAGTADQVAYDKAHGINTYAQNNPGNSWQLLKDAGMFSLYSANGAPANDTRQVGMMLDDEVDGRYTDAAGIKHLQDIAAQYAPPSSGLFRYVNYTSSIVTYDRSMASSSAYYNGLQDAVSLDQYFYSVPQCGWGADRLRWRTPAGGTAITPTNCRTASSYGKMIDLQREVDAQDGNLQPLWGFVEVISTGGTTNGYQQPTGAQIKGAAMNSIIHGARGIDWFSQSPDQGAANTCPSGDALRDARVGAGCAAVATNVAAMGDVNAVIKALAPVINTQSYKWSFGTGIDSMLKVNDGSAYIFAMPTDGGSGARTFTLPAGVNGTTVTVLNEDRTLNVSDGKFTDTFAAESTYHIYKINLS